MNQSCRFTADDQYNNMQPSKRDPGASRFRFMEGILPISRAQVPAEILAGVTFAALAIPEVMGYTRIAGMPVVTGLYTLLLPMAVFAFFGSSRHLVVGADSATAAIIAGSLIAMAAPKSPEYVGYAAMVALLAALLLIAASLFKIGFVADFLSRTVLIGFLTGVGIQIAIGQLAGMAGIPLDQYGTLMQVIFFSGAVPCCIHLPTVLLSVSVITVIIVARTIGTRVPGALIAVAGAMIASFVFDLSSYGISVLGPVPGGLPTISFPQVALSDLPELTGIAIACFVVILAQSAATSRAYALKFSDSYDENTDLLGLGVANAAAGITGTFVVNGSPTKTEMVYAAGGQTQLTQLTTVAIVLAVLVFITQPLSYLPSAALAAVVFLIGLHLVDIRGMNSLRTRRPVEFGVALITAFTVIFFSVTIGIAVAVVLSILAHLRHSYRPLDTLLVLTSGGGMKPTPLEDGRQAADGFIVYRFGSNLYFANESRFTTEVLNTVANARPQLKWFCLSAANIGDVDYTSAEMLRLVITQVQKRGVTFVMSEVGDRVREEFDRDGISALIGEGHIFESVQDAIEAYKTRKPGTYD
jgi:SulP family sulfate permease